MRKLSIESIINNVWSKLTVNRCNLDEDLRTTNWMIEYLSIHQPEEMPRLLAKKEILEKQIPERLDRIRAQITMNHDLVPESFLQLAMPYLKRYRSCINDNQGRWDGYRVIWEDRSGLLKYMTCMVQDKDGERRKSFAPRDKFLNDVFKKAQELGYLPSHAKLRIDCVRWGKDILASYVPMDAELSSFIQNGMDEDNKSYLCVMSALRHVLSERPLISNGIGEYTSMIFVSKYDLKHRNYTYAGVTDCSVLVEIGDYKNPNDYTIYSMREWRKLVAESREVTERYRDMTTELRPIRTWEELDQLWERQLHDEAERFRKEYEHKLAAWIFQEQLEAHMEEYEETHNFRKAEHWLSYFRDNCIDIPEVSSVFGSGFNPDRQLELLERRTRPYGEFYNSISDKYIPGGRSRTAKILKMCTIGMTLDEYAEQCASLNALGETFKEHADLMLASDAVKCVCGGYHRVSARICPHCGRWNQNIEESFGSVSIWERISMDGDTAKLHSSAVSADITDMDSESYFEYFGNPEGTQDLDDMTEVEAEDFLDQEELRQELLRAGVTESEIFDNDLVVRTASEAMSEIFDMSFKKGQFSLDMDDPAWVPVK